MKRFIQCRMITIITIFISSMFLQFVQAEARRPECIVPAKRGGGLDMTCKLVQSSFEETELIMRPIRLVYMPGKIGATAYDFFTTDRNDDVNTVIAFSTGTLLSIAQGKYGQHDEHDVRWLAAIGIDYGALFVRADSPLKNLKDFVEALQNHPQSVLIGVEGAEGNQDWMQVALLSKSGQYDAKKITYRSFEGGGDIIESLFHKKIQVMSSSLSEMMPYMDSGDIRVLAVFSEEDIGELYNIPTAKSQGYDVVWPVVRGVYVGPNVTESDYQWWKSKFDALLIHKEFDGLRAQYDMLPFALTGNELDQYIDEQVHYLRGLSEEFDLVK